MPCTTILVGKCASYDGSTMIARNDDGGWSPKHLIVNLPEKQPKKYKSVIGHLTIELPENPMRYTSIPNVDVREEGLWPACGFNEAHVAMTATETITSNARVMGADPLVFYQKANGKKKEVPGGIGEEDIVALVLPYIRSAREGVIRLGALLEQYGTYECNGIAFNDENEVWWLETIGGHHWIARRVEDNEVVIMPNQFGLDRFDIDDAFGKQEKNLCSKDLREFVEKNHLNPEQDGSFNPRTCFGSHDDSDHIYNTPRAWFLGRYFLPKTYKWDGEDADFTPESDDIPWSFVPEKKVTPEDIKYALSSHYQGTPYDTFSASPLAKHYRPIAVANTDDLAILQIRGYMPDALKCVEWLSLGSNVYNVSLPLYGDTDTMPDFIAKGSVSVSTENYYWMSRLVGVLADAHFGKNLQPLERYQKTVSYKSRAILNTYDAKIGESGDPKLIREANEKLVQLLKEETQKFLDKVMHTACEGMRNRFHREDN